jgi:chromosome segregation ATPase
MSINIASKPSFTAPPAPNPDNVGSVLAQIESKCGQLKGISQDIQSLMNELSLLEPPSNDLGDDPSEEDVAKFQKALKDFQDKVEKLNRKIAGLQRKLGQVQGELNTLQFSEMPKAERQDAEAIKKWSKDSQEALEKQLEATSSSSDETKDLTANQAENQARIKQQSIKKQIELSDGSTAEVKITQFAIQLGDDAAQSTAKPTLTDMPKPPAVGF